MSFHLPDPLQPFLVPLLIAVPLAVLVWFITVRRGDHSDFAVPRATPPSPAVPPAKGGADAGPHPVMVVDDSAVVRAKLTKLFQEAGHDVIAARDGVEALELLSQHVVSVMVTDLEMPNMDGFELIRSVQGSIATEDLPIIAITGHEELHARLHQVQGLYGMFQKPWNDRELLKRVESLIQMRRART